MSELESKPSYPIEILPHPHFKKRMNINTLLRKYGDLMVVRLVKGKEDDYKIDMGNGEFVLDVFKDSMANLSMNLAGGLFVTRASGHLPFLALSDYGTKTWQGNKVDAKNFLPDESYSYDYPCFGLCFRVCDIHMKTLPFHRGFKTQQQRDEYAKAVEGAASEWTGPADAKLVGDFEKKSPSRVRARLVLHHAPTNGNYWHVTLDTYRPTETDYVHSGDIKSLDRNMFKALKQNLLQCYQIDSLIDYKIARKYYIKLYAHILPCIA